MTENSSFLVRDIRRYLAYFLERKGFTQDTEAPPVSEAARRAALKIRGANRDPAILLHGIMPRSGTVYVGQLMKLHPDVHDYPFNLWELPALMLSSMVRQLERRFLLEYKPNIGRIGENDFLAIFGAALLGYLYEEIPSGYRMIMKDPSVQYISHFFSMFPHENLLLLIRDGRDIVHSTLRTWPQLNFLQVCLRWDRSAQALLQATERFRRDYSEQFKLARFEEILAEPAAFVQEICSQFGLDPGRYPYERIGDLKVIGSSKLTMSGEEVTWQWKSKPEGFRPTEYWREWNALRKLVFKAVAGRSLVALGYSDDLNW